MSNSGLCSTCGKLVPAATVERGGKIYLRRDCPRCGANETMISGDARRYQEKRALDNAPEPQACGLNCLDCEHKQAPNIVFLDVTNRCNLNCPCCINNTPSMGFLFEPPLEYFERIFAHLAAFKQPPSIQLFGGEPTVREDLFKIIHLARRKGLAVRVVTNGLKLADRDYCERLVKARATVLLSYDGDKEEIYRVLRGNGAILARKQQALDNLNACTRAKVTIMALIARGFNDDILPGLIQFCHERRNSVRAVYLMPLAHTWNPADFALEPERITGEELEALVDSVFGADTVHFLPAGFLGQVQTIIKYTRLAVLPFAGAHPNCESMYLMLSDGEQYLPLARYLKTDVATVAHDFQQLEKRLVAREQRLTRGVWGRLGLRDWRMRVSTYLGIAGVFRRNANFGAFVAGRGPAKLGHGLALAFGLLWGKRSRDVLRKHSRAQGTLQIVVLPFEDKSTLETDRLARCPSAFAYYDPAEDKVHHVPVCAWPLHKAKVMRHIADFYANSAAPASSPSA